MSHQAITDFLAEAEDLLDKLHQDMLELGDRLDGGQGNPELLNGIFRDAHSIKGLAGMFGFDDIAELSHHLETLLDHLRLGKVSLDATVLDCLFDTLEGIATLTRGKVEDPDFSQDISSYQLRIEHLLSGPDDGNENLFSRLDLDADMLGALTEYEEHRLQENIRQNKHLYLVKIAFSLLSFDTELEGLSNRIRSVGEVISTLPGAVNDDPELLAFQILCGTELSAEALRESLSTENADIEPIALRPAAGAWPEPITAPTDDDFAEMPQDEPVSGSEEKSAKSISSTVRVDIGKLDHLMNIVGELALAKGTIAQLCDDVRDAGLPVARDLEKAVHDLGRRLNELQGGVMDVRMVPVRQLFDKMNRILRRMAQELGKKVQLEIRGGDTELDKLIVEDLSDPLMHIIRNALDHGIESPEERKAIGKPESGTITLLAAQRGNHVVIEVRDDGRGLDTQMLRTKGIEKSLLSSDVSYSRQELFNLLFQPGFSTRDQVSEFSGRGVGMDVVKNNITALSGMIDLDSETGRGTCISLTLPITLAIIKALVVRVRDIDYAIPLNAVLETLLLEPGMLKTVEAQDVLELRDQTFALLRIDRLFGLVDEEAPDKPSELDDFDDLEGFELDSKEQPSQFVVVVGFADKRVGLLVDELCGQQDVVIKSLGKALGFVKGIAGAADLGNQKTILVLDVSGLIGEAMQLEGVLSR